MATVRRRATLAGRAMAEPNLAEKRDAALEHLDGLLSQLGARAGVRHARKHLAAYADHAIARTGAGAGADRRRLVTSDDPVEVRRLLASFFEAGEPEVEAA
jgi:tRNA-dihydrouridine synthase B